MSVDLYTLSHSRMDDIFDYYGIPDGMEDIAAQYAKAKEEYQRLQKVLEDAREEQLRKKVLEIEEQIPTYTKKLERLKAYVDAFKNECRGRYVQYGFRKVESYKSDDHQPMADPLDWRICEYDLLGIDENLDIVFDYSNEAVKKFVSDWMEKNMECASQDLDVGNSYFWKE